MGKWRRVKSLARRWQRNHLVAKYGAVCYICGEPLSMKQITIDHWLPLSRGGTDEIDNYRIAHKLCNRIKADMTPEEFELFQKGEIQYQ
jgi:5-methylcytosine-specific restriction endonuclease McrA